MIEEVRPKKIGSKGQSVYTGSNAIGKTLQAELNITTTTTRNIKASQSSTSLRGANRINSARVPDWRMASKLFKTDFRSIWQR